MVSDTLSECVLRCRISADHRDCCCQPHRHKVLTAGGLPPHLLGQADLLLPFSNSMASRIISGHCGRSIAEVVHNNAVLHALRTASGSAASTSTYHPSSSPATPQQTSSRPLLSSVTCSTRWTFRTENPPAHSSNRPSLASPSSTQAMISTSCQTRDLREFMDWSARNNKPEDGTYGESPA